MMLLLRHPPRGPLGGPLRKPAALRGASRIVTPEALLAAPSFSLEWLGSAFRMLVAVVLLVALYQVGRQLPPLVSPALTRIELLGDSPYISREDVLRRISSLEGSSYFSADLDAIHQRLQDMPWVAGAEVRRVWPDQLQVRLTGQLPLARWGADSLLSASGSLFQPADMAAFAELPQLIGPAGHEQELMQQYHLFSRMLRPTGLSIARLELHERGSWFIGTRQGIELLLGRDHIAEKLQRLAMAFDSALKEHINEIVRVDLRYPNALAVAWRDGHAPAPAVAGEAR